MAVHTVPTICQDTIVVATFQDVVHQCPYAPETDESTVIVSWITREETIELHALRAYLDEFADISISHEDLAATIYADLNGAEVYELVGVTVNAENRGGWFISVDRSGT